ncbi:thioredoxin fold domain-containing protein [Pseudomonas serbica]|uniref:thioredoxin fold domain-containing protein n=1 Tax=Pseudomonas serbica TaxID=2965074 RepID=UPI00237BD1CD|nr:thioredoxin fold domain-containing protein [Pseudomonas serbica]
MFSKKSKFGFPTIGLIAAFSLMPHVAQAEGLGSFLSELTQPPLPKPAPQYRFVRDAMSKLTADEYISFSPANPKAHVYVLADAFCPWTRELHKSVPEFNAKGIEVRYVAAPDGSISGPAWTAYRNIWCSNDPAKAFDDAMKGRAVKASTCGDNKLRTLAAQSQFMQAMPTNATPTTFFQDGSWIEGTDAQIVSALPDRAILGAKIVGQYGAR